MRKCRICGQPSSVGGNFCENCGEALSSSYEQSNSSLLPRTSVSTPRSPYALGFAKVDPCFGIDRDCGCNDPCCCREWGMGERPTGFSKKTKQAAVDSVCPDVESPPCWSDDSQQKHVERHRLAIQLLNEGRYEESISHVEWLLRKYPKSKDLNLLSGHARISYSTALYRNGDQSKATQQVKKAENALRAALKLDPNSPKARYWLGVALERLGQEKQAMKEYRHAIRYAPEFGPAIERLEYLREKLGKHVSEENPCGGVTALIGLLGFAGWP